MIFPGEYLSLAYWDDLRKRLRETFGEEKATLLYELAQAVVHQHEEDDHKGSS